MNYTGGRSLPLELSLFQRAGCLYSAVNASDRRSFTGYAWKSAADVTGATAVTIHRHLGFRNLICLCNATIVLVTAFRSLIHRKRVGFAGHFSSFFVHHLRDAEPLSARNLFFVVFVSGQWGMSLLKRRLLALSFLVSRDNGVIVFRIDGELVVGSGDFFLLFLVFGDGMLFCDVFFKRI